MIKVIKLITKLIKHVNRYTSQIIQQVFLIFMWPKQDMPISEKYNNTSSNFGPDIDKESILEK